MTIVGAMVLTTVFAVAAEEFTPTAAYGRSKVEGFEVLVHPELKLHPVEAATAEEELRSQLKTIVRTLPAAAVTELKKVRLWMEWRAKPEGAAEFHPSREWLTENGYNPEKTGAVELSNAVNFVEWSRRAQPCMVLHELAHAYHFLKLGENHAGVEAAYKQAIDRKLYEKVDYIKGGKRLAYARTNAKEYYAELSEAYFGKNDFFPFNRAELKTHDPVGYAIMEATWEPPA
ncbi:MAG: hypothetical protein ACRC1K_01895, partial [Planctomycetia bacterium]